MWLPCFACPECGAAIDGDPCGCPHCERRYEQRDGVWRFLAPARLASLEPFLEQYRRVRAREGWRLASPDYYRRLPSVDAADPHARDWRIRRETYHHLLRHVLAAAPQSIRVLDVGAGNGWLSHRLAELGHRLVASDALDDECDGLGAAKYYGSGFVAVQADFDALPFAPRQFDLVVFNGSLHYARDVAATLAHAHRLLAPGGSLAVMDSPMFDTDADGRAMVADMVRRFRSDYDLPSVVQPQVGYLTFGSLSAVAATFGLRVHFVPSRGPLGWQVRRQLARLRLQRAPAAFGLWVAR